MSKFENKPVNIDLKGPVLSIASMRGLISLAVRRAGQFRDESVRRFWVGSFLGHNGTYVDYVLSSADAEIAKQNLEEVRRRKCIVSTLKEGKDCNTVLDCCNQSVNARFRYGLVCGRPEHQSHTDTDRGYNYREFIPDEVNVMRRDLLSSLRERY